MATTTDAIAPGDADTGSDGQSGVFRPFVDGRRVAGKDLFEVHCPADGELVLRWESAGPEQVADALSAAERAFRASDWSDLQPRSRARILHRIADVVEDQTESLARLDALCTGRPLRELAPQVGRLPEWFRYFAGLVEGLEGGVLPVAHTHLNYTERVPLGVVAQIVTWNHPLLLLVKKLAPALATGNCVIVKPSELTPASAILLAEACAAAGVPKGVVNVVPGFGASGAALVSDRRVAKVDFTGGTVTGRAIATAAAENVIPATLELGGKTPVIILSDADVERAVSGSLFAAFIAAGQTCVSGAYFLVARPIYDEFIDRFSTRAAALRLGHPLDPATQIGSLISDTERARVLESVVRAQEEGARLITGGQKSELEPPLDRGAFVAPTVLADVSPEMRIAKEEVFGPVACVSPFDTDEEAVSTANSSQFGLGASIWTESVSRAHRMARALRYGVVWVNDHHRNDPSSPWGGFRLSGYGRENGWESLYAYTSTRSIVVNLSDDVFDWFDSTPEGKRYG